MLHLFIMHADTRDIRTVCLNCFATLDKSGFCFHCRTRKDDDANPPSALSLRTLLNGRYLIARQLGAGGFGITYLAWDLYTSKRVAIKEFFPKNYTAREPHTGQVRVSSPEHIVAFNHWRRAFVHEAQILIRINHLHGIAKLLDFFEENNTAYIVMDYLEGQTLRDYLSARGYKVTVKETLDIMRPILESLVILHQYGVIHKDISPENIIIVQNKYVKLIDFGAAALYNDPRNEKPFMVLKAGFSPIEFYRPAECKQGPWSDVYQVGATIYNAITGYIPADAQSRVQQDRLPRPSQLGAVVPVAVENAIMKALQILPEKRYDNMGDFIQMLYGEFLPLLRK